MDYDMIMASSMEMDLEGKVELYPMEDKRRNMLCEQLLDLINESVTSFKPSKSLAMLEPDEPSSPSKQPPVEIDIVVSGGGLKGYFMAGCSHILLHELDKQNVKIARIAGASAGAWCGLFMLTNIGTETWLETYYLCKERPGMTMHEAYTELWPWMQSRLPENAYEICSGRLFVSITEVTMFGLKNHMISEFTSNDDLFEACMASSTVPYISLPTAMRKFRNMWVIDGGVTNNTPAFPDQTRRQLIFQLGDVFYPVKFLINPNDLCIESLVVRGAILMSRFLQGEPSDSFSWLNPSGYIGSLKHTTGAFAESDRQVTKRKSTSWTTVLTVSVLSAAVLGGGYYLLKEDRKNAVKAFFKDLTSLKFRLF